MHTYIGMRYTGPKFWGLLWTLIPAGLLFCMQGFSWTFFLGGGGGGGGAEGGA